MNYIWIPSYQAELYHFGVKGMKWGVRRKPKYSSGHNGEGVYLYKADKYASKGTAKGYSKALNSLERGYADQVGKSLESKYSDNAWIGKEKKKAKGVNAGKAAMKIIERTNKLIQEAEKKGYVVNSRTKTLYTNSYVNTSKFSGGYQVQYVGKKYVVSNEKKKPNLLRNWNDPNAKTGAQLVQYRYYYY